MATCDPQIEKLFPGLLEKAEKRGINLTKPLTDGQVKEIIKELNLLNLIREKAPDADIKIPTAAEVEAHMPPSTAAAAGGYRTQRGGVRGTCALLTGLIFAIAGGIGGFITNPLRPLGMEDHLIDAARASHRAGVAGELAAGTTTSNMRSAALALQRVESERAASLERVAASTRHSGPNAGRERSAAAGAVTGLVTGAALGLGLNAIAYESKLSAAQKKVRDLEVEIINIKEQISESTRRQTELVPLISGLRTLVASVPTVATQIQLVETEQRDLPSKLERLRSEKSTKCSLLGVARRELEILNPVGITSYPHDSTLCSETETASASASPAPTAPALPASSTSNPFAGGKSRTKKRNTRGKKQRRRRYTSRYR